MPTAGRRSFHIQLPSFDKNRRSKGPDIENALLPYCFPSQFANYDLMKAAVPVFTWQLYEESSLDRRAEINKVIYEIERNWGNPSDWIPLEITPQPVAHVLRNQGLKPQNWSLQYLRKLHALAQKTKGLLDLAHSCMYKVVSRRYESTGPFSDITKYPHLMVEDLDCVEQEVALVMAEAAAESANAAKHAGETDNPNSVKHADSTKSSNATEAKGATTDVDAVESTGNATASSAGSSKVKQQDSHPKEQPSDKSTPPKQKKSEQEEKQTVIKSISKNWPQSPTSWLPNDLLPARTGGKKQGKETEPMKWNLSLLKKLRALSNETKMGLPLAQRFMREQIRMKSGDQVRPLTGADIPIASEMQPLLQKLIVKLKADKEAAMQGSKTTIATNDDNKVAAEETEDDESTGDIEQSRAALDAEPKAVATKSSSTKVLQPALSRTDVSHHQEAQDEVRIQKSHGQAVKAATGKAHYETPSSSENDPRRSESLPKRPISRLESVHSPVPGEDANKRRKYGIGRDTTTPLTGPEMWDNSHRSHDEFESEHENAARRFTAHTPRSNHLSDSNYIEEQDSPHQRADLMLKTASHRAALRNPVGSPPRRDSFQPTRSNTSYGHEHLQQADESAFESNHTWQPCGHKAYNGIRDMHYCESTLTTNGITVDDLKQELLEKNFRIQELEAKSMRLELHMKSKDRRIAELERKQGPSR